MGRLGDSSGGQVTRIEKRGGREVGGGGQDARAPPGTGSPCSHPSPPGIPSRPNSTCGAHRDGGALGREGEGGGRRMGWGWGRDRSAPCPVPRGPCCTPGTRESPSAPSSPPLGRVWACWEIRTCLVKGWLPVNRRNELSPSTFMVLLLCAERSLGPFQLLGSGTAPSVGLHPRAGKESRAVLYNKFTVRTIM